MNPPFHNLTCSSRAHESNLQSIIIDGFQMSTTFCHRRSLLCPQTAPRVQVKRAAICVICKRHLSSVLDQQRPFLTPSGWGSHGIVHLSLRPARRRWRVSANAQNRCQLPRNLAMLEVINMKKSSQVKWSC
ncbi:hypothetical protein HBH98_195130 [Parastagonospora nodorum]|nr:hypothetical protein HBH52_213730 [Parastagonospora nodorum]KAH4084025.1 hypothetical protein HBH46_215290 [Parastagonospora nodorum]KAH4340323.1 hypothetical protein HBH98_195130 [Parastagonospora nodorum]KAH4362893.1 hypothetical protein HBH97_191360 [Parastagonospora nodorum]KAH4404309.1 hypothetical protein HBH92_192550 [Parastagonospora nodorum]